MPAWPGTGRVQEQRLRYFEGIMRLMEVVPGEANPVALPGEEDNLSQRSPFPIVNIGGGQPIELLRFVDTVDQAVAISAIRKMLPTQKGDVPRTFASADLLAALTGFRPSTPVETGVRAFVDGYRAELVVPAVLEATEG